MVTPRWGGGADNIIVFPDSDRMNFLFFSKSLVHAWPLHTARGGQGVAQSFAAFLALVPAVTSRESAAGLVPALGPTSNFFFIPFSPDPALFPDMINK